MAHKQPRILGLLNFPHGSLGSWKRGICSARTGGGPPDASGEDGKKLLDSPIALVCQGPTCHPALLKHHNLLYSGPPTAAKASVAESGRKSGGSKRMASRKDF